MQLPFDGAISAYHNNLAPQKLRDAIAQAGKKDIVDTASAGKGALSIAIKAAGQDVKHSIRDIGQGRFELTYIPNLPIPHKLDLKYNNCAISKKAFEVQVQDSLYGKVITASGLGLYQAKANHNTSFVIDTMGHKSNEFDVIIIGPPDAIPPNEAIPLRCYQQKDGKLLAQFTTLASGPHRIEVYINNEHIR